MILSKNNILSRKIISGGEDVRYRGSSYDLSILKLITADSKVEDEFLLQPQGMVKVVSAEVLNLPVDVMGYVFVKTSLCNEGVLALNIGIVDPGFNGPLQSVLINFGKSPIRLSVGSVFSRITFQIVADGEGGLVPGAVKTHETVISEVKRLTDLYMAPTFLDVEASAKKAAEAAFNKYKTSLIGWVPIIALAMTFMTFALNFGNMWLLQSYSKPQDQVRTELLAKELQNRMDALEGENKSLKVKIEAADSSLQGSLGKKVSTSKLGNVNVK